MTAKRCRCDRPQCHHTKTSPQCARAVDSPLGRTSTILLCGPCFADYWDELYKRPPASETKKE